MTQHHHQHHHHGHSNSSSCRWVMWIFLAAGLILVMLAVHTSNPEKWSSEEVTTAAHQNSVVPLREDVFGLGRKVTADGASAVKNPHASSTNQQGESGKGSGAHDNNEGGATAAQRVLGVLPPSPGETNPTLIVNENELFVQGNKSIPPHSIGKLDAQGYLALPEDIETVYVEVGTNDVPEFTPLIVAEPKAVLLAFEPQPPVFLKMVADFPKPKQLIAIPAAITPTQTLVDMHVAEHKGCSSLLAMNPRLTRFAHKQIKHAIKKSMAIQLRTMEYCARRAETIPVPSFPLHEVLKRIPPRITTAIVATDAQGYDLHVLSTIGKENAKKVPFIIAECQDLAPGGVLMLVQGAPNCQEVRQCVESNFVNHVIDFCWDNAPRARELNCLFRNKLMTADKYVLPPQLKVVSANRTLYEPPRKDFVCPEFAPTVSMRGSRSASTDSITSDVVAKVAPMLVAVRCRGLNDRERAVGAAKFPNRQDTRYCSVVQCSPEAGTVAVIDPDSVGQYRCHLFPPPNSASLPAGQQQQSSRRGPSAEEEDDETKATRAYDREYCFDVAFGPSTSNDVVYHQTVAPLVRCVKEGFNGTCFAYGMTGAGKTYTMLGTACGGSEQQQQRSGSVKGLCSLAAEDLFEDEYGLGTIVHASYLELYNERIRDLLAAPKTPTSPTVSSRRPGFSLNGRIGSSGSSKESSLDIVEDPVKGVNVPGLTEVLVTTTEQLEKLIAEGGSRRTKAAMTSNEASSRSHAILQLSVRRRVPGAGANEDRVLCGKLCLIDLAGSERALTDGGVQREQRRREGANINRSLLSLGNCITILGNLSSSATTTPAAGSAPVTSGSATPHIPYRDSKLTRLLKESLGGNTRTVMIASISPSCLCYEETLSTLKYATRAKAITRRVQRNSVTIEDRNTYEQDFKATIRSLRSEVESLQAQLYITKQTNAHLGLIALPQAALHQPQATTTRSSTIPHFQHHPQRSQEVQGGHHHWCSACPTVDETPQRKAHLAFMATIQEQLASLGGGQHLSMSPSPTKPTGTSTSFSLVDGLGDGIADAPRGATGLSVGVGDLHQCDDAMRRSGGSPMAADTGDADNILRLAEGPSPLGMMMTTTSRACHDENTVPIPGPTAEPYTSLLQQLAAGSEGDFPMPTRVPAEENSLEERGHQATVVFREQCANMSNSPKKTTSGFVGSGQITMSPLSQQPSRNQSQHGTNKRAFGMLSPALHERARENEGGGAQRRHGVMSEAGKAMLRLIAERSSVPELLLLDAQEA